jgi:hypothetical protein
VIFTIGPEIIHTAIVSDVHILDYLLGKKKHNNHSLNLADSMRLW